MLFLFGYLKILSPSLVVSTIRLPQYSIEIRVNQLKHLTSTSEMRLALTGHHTGNRLLVPAYGDHAHYSMFPKKMWCVWQDIIDRICFIYSYFPGIVYRFRFSSVLFWWAPRCYFKSSKRRILTKTSFIFQSKRRSDLIFMQSSIHQKSAALHWYSHQPKSGGSFLEVFFFGVC